MTTPPQSGSPHVPGTRGHALNALSAAASADGSAGDRAKAGAQVVATVAVGKAASAAVVASTGSAALGTATDKVVQTVVANPRATGRWLMIGAGGIAAAVLLAPLVSMTLVSTVLSSVLAAEGQYENATSVTSGCALAPVASSDELEVSWSPVQVDVANAIADQTARMDLDPYAAVVAVSAAMADTELGDNIGSGHGVFGWDDAGGEDLDDVPTATRAFLGTEVIAGHPGLQLAPQWLGQPVAMNAQAVQATSSGSAYYAAEHDARILVGAHLQVPQIISCLSGLVGEGEWAYPLPLGSWRNNSPFNPTRFHPIHHVVMPHLGTDLGAPAGTPVFAVAGGIVTAHPMWGSAGNAVIVTMPDGNDTRYYHLSAFAVSDGATVRAGQLIGYVGNTGGSTGDHLHLELHIDGKAVDPIPVLLERGINLTA